MKKLRGKLTFSNVIACLALFVALGGSAYAATQLPKNSVGSKQLKKGAVTPAKLSNGATSTFAGPKGATGAQGLQGPRGVEGAAGTALAYARIETTGGLDATQSKNVAGMTVTNPQTGLYCLSNLPFTAKNVIATTQSGDTSINLFVGRFVGCAAGTQVSIEENFTGNEQAERSAPFMIMFN